MLFSEKEKNKISNRLLDMIGMIIIIIIIFCDFLKSLNKIKVTFQQDFN